MDKRIIGFFDDRNMAQKAIQDLEQAGISRSEIELLSEDGDLLDSSSSGQSSHKMSFMDKVKSFFTGTSEYDLSEEDRSVYAESLRRGGYLVSVNSDEARSEQIAGILSSDGAVDIDRRGEYYREKGWSGYSADAPIYSADERLNFRNDYSNWEQLKYGGKQETEVIPVVEEKLNVGKRSYQTGGVRVLSRIREVPVEEKVQLREEHVEVERRPVDRAINTNDMQAFKESSIEITESAEKAFVDKEARVVEEVAVRKDVDERTETIRDTVRRTDVDIEKLGPEDRPRH